MNTKTLLGVSLAATFAVLMMTTPMASAAITGLLSTVITNNSDVDYDVLFTLSGDVVTDGSDFGGYAFFTDGGDVVAVTSHQGAYDSEKQNFPNKNKTFDVCTKGQVEEGYCEATWHAHVVKPVANAACTIAAVGGLTFEDPSSDITIVDDTILVEGVPIGTIPYTNSVTGQSTDFNVADDYVSPNPVTNSGDGVGFPLVPVFDGNGNAANANHLVAICIGPAA